MFLVTYKDRRDSDESQIGEYDSMSVAHNKMLLYFMKVPKSFENCEYAKIVNTEQDVKYVYTKQDIANL